MLQAIFVSPDGTKRVLYDGVEMAPQDAGLTAAEWAEVNAAEAPPTVSVPESVSRFQARAALHLAGFLPAVEIIMADPQTDALARMAWQDAQEFRRHSPTVNALAMALGMDDAQLDTLFVTAGGIEA